MKPKKSQKANLEKSRFIYFQVGLIIALAFVLFAFELASKEKTIENENMLSSQLFLEDDVMLSVKQRQPEKKKIEIYTIINKVDDDNLTVDDPVFSFGEIDPGASFDLSLFVHPVEIFDDTNEYITVRDMPLFNGGNPDKEFTRYIKQHLRYPERAQINGVSGTVILTFVINKQGLIENLDVFNPAHPDLDREAMSVVGKSPPWTPGKQNGKPVRVRYYFPVTFKLN